MTPQEHFLDPKRVTINPDANNAFVQTVDVTSFGGGDWYMMYCSEKSCPKSYDQNGWNSAGPVRVSGAKELEYWMPGHWTYLTKESTLQDVPQLFDVTVFGNDLNKDDKIKIV